MLLLVYGTWAQKLTVMVGSHSVRAQHLAWKVSASSVKPSSITWKCLVSFKPWLLPPSLKIN